MRRKRHGVCVIMRMASSHYDTLVSMKMPLLAPGRGVE